MAARDRPTRQLIYDPNCEMAHRQQPFSLVVLSGWPPLGGCSSAAGRWFSFLENCHARFQSHGHYGVALSHSSVHLERVNQRGFACAEYRVQRFSRPRRRRTGLFYFFFLPTAAGGAPVKKDAGVMWYFWSDFAFDLVKGLIAGGASLAFQAVAPMTFRALKRFRARWSVRKAARKAARRAE
jgi:hypothetical protein